MPRALGSYSLNRMNGGIIVGRQSWRLALSLQAVLTQASWVGVRLMVGYQALGEGADAPFLGIIAATFALPGLVAALPAGRLSDRLGGATVSFAGILIAVAGTAALVLSSGLGMLLAASLFIGLGHLLVLVGQQTFVAHRSDDGSRDSAFGALTAAISIGQLIGPPLVTTATAFADPGANPALPDPTAGLLAALACAVLAAPLYAVLRSADRASPRPARPAATVKHGMGTLLGTPGMRRSLMVSAAIVVTMDMLYAFIPFWAIGQDVGIATVGWLLALRSAITVVSRLGLARLVGRFGRKSLLITAISAGSVSFAVLPAVGVSGAVVVMIGLGIGLGLPQPLTMSWVVGLVHPNYHGAALGLRTTSNRLAQAAIPLAVSTGAAAFGAAAIFWASAALLAGAALLVVRSEPEK